MAYSRFRALWKSGKAGNTPISAASLNHIEDGIVAASTAAGAAQTTADAAQSVANAAAQVLVWNGSAWVTPSGAAGTAGVPKIYLRESGEPDPTSSMVAGDMLWTEGAAVGGSVSYVGGDSVSGGDNTNPQTLVMPTVEDNDIGVIVIASDGVSTYPTYSGLSGWTQASTQDLEVNRNSRSEVWWKVLTAGESDVTFTPDVAAEKAGHLSVWRGAHQTAPIGNVANDEHSAEAAPTPPAVTTVADNSGIIVVQHNLGTTATTAFVAPTGYDLRTDERSIWGAHSATATLEDAGSAGSYSPPAWQSTASSAPDATTTTIAITPA